MNCPNCQNKSTELIREIEVTQKKIPAKLIYCSACDFLYLEDPNWLDIAYETQFYADTGFVNRNIIFANRTILIFRIWKLLSKNSLFPNACDIGAGLGMFARIMRDKGYNFCGSDEYSSMPLLNPFVVRDSKCAIKTSFEVVEHLPSLNKFLKEKVKEVDFFLFSTELRQNGKIPDNNWWYYSFPLGQHIGFHSKKSLEVAFIDAGYDSENLVSFGNSFHALANTRNWKLAFKIASYYWKISYYFNKICNKLFCTIFNEKSLTIGDSKYALDLLKNKN